MVFYPTSSKQHPPVHSRDEQFNPYLVEPEQVFRLEGIQCYSGLAFERHIERPLVLQLLVGGDSVAIEPDTIASAS